MDRPLWFTGLKESREGRYQEGCHQRHLWGVGRGGGGGDVSDPEEYSRRQLHLESGAQRQGGHI